MCEVSFAITLTLQHFLLKYILGKYFFFGFWRFPYYLAKK